MTPVPPMLLARRDHGRDPNAQLGEVYREVGRYAVALAENLAKADERAEIVRECVRDWAKARGPWQRGARRAAWRKARVRLANAAREMQVSRAWMVLAVDGLEERWAARVNARAQVEAMEREWRKALEG